MVTVNPLDQLQLADPQLADVLRTALLRSREPVSAQFSALLAEDALWGLVQDEAFGQLFARAMAELLESAGPDQVEYYRITVRKAAATGITLANLLATHLLPVLASQDPALLAKFTAALSAMRTKGIYCLKPPLECMSYLLRSGQAAAAAAFLKLLACVFSRDLNYNRCLTLSNSLPKAVRRFTGPKRCFQIGQLIRVAETDVDLIDPFLDALQSGLEMLSRDALARFVSLGLEKFADQAGLGRKFFALESRAGQEALSLLQVAADLGRMRPTLERYLKARTGLCLPIQPLTRVADWLPDGLGCQICSDGRRMYLPDEMDIYGQKAQNEAHYKLLTRLEAGLFEFGTFAFDLERALERIPQPAHDGFDASAKAVMPVSANDAEPCDLLRFYNLFDLPALAEDLFNIFESGRIRKCLARNYPGLARSGFQPLIDAAGGFDHDGHFLMPLYRAVALGEAVDLAFAGAIHGGSVLRQAFLHFDQSVGPDEAVEASAELTARCYPKIRDLGRPSAGALQTGYQTLPLPFGRKIQAGLWHRGTGTIDRLARRIKARLCDHGVKVYAADVRTQLLQKDGELGPEDLVRIIGKARNLDPQGTPGISLDMASLVLDKILDEEGNRTGVDPSPADSAYRYKEWDYRLQDYLERHVRVVEQPVSPADSDLYAKILERRRGIAQGMRRAFELLKPEGLSILRQWIEGDAFDYRALLDFAVDRKAGLMPSDRLYIKRLKRQRDVAVLLLVDLSRSTANRAAGTPYSVLDVEKEAIVLFCEALTVVGDAFAVAGFSGSGRLNVVYFKIKDFSDPLNEPVKQRIGAIAPQRSTRMGAAIRHATRYLAQAPQKVRLLIILSDGFPNDLDYKSDYAVEDTHKAVLEARARNIFTKAITVNMGADSRLDDLYGAAQHYVIADVKDLPDRLLRVYGRLTR
jgi:hypothetical protein